MRRFVEWRYVTSNTSGASFDAVMAFLEENPGWPRRTALIERAENILPAMTPSELTVWFGDRAPVSFLGAIRLGGALIASGRREEGADLIRRAWVEGSFTPEEERDIERAHFELLTGEDRRQRVLQALARGDIAAAQRQVPHLDDNTQLIARTRIELRRSPITVLNAPLPSALQSEAGLVFDQARALRQVGNDELAWSTLSKIPVGDTLLSVAIHWWTERHIMSRDALKARRPDLAYKLASEHGLKSGPAFADAEFLSGWIALRYLNDAERAASHFEKVIKGVVLPISLGRGYYWLGRAREAQTRMDDAVEAYRDAAAYPETFYGQLALTRLERSPILVLPRDSRPAENELAKSDDRIRVVLLLAELGERHHLQVFALHLAREIDGADRLALLSTVIADLGDRTGALRIAKIASYNRVLLPQFSPVIDLPRSASAVERALVLSIVRQESEFDASATSPSGARGLMQLIPATAKATATTRKVPFRPARLTEPAYNLELGAAYLAKLISEWNGSYVLAIASYNAGPQNVRRWIETNGDPRTSGIDPIDWVELIPFGETRNYVQRVLENVQVYRSVTSGGEVALRLAADLHRPNDYDAQIPAPMFAKE